MSFARVVHKLDAWLAFLLFWVISVALKLPHQRRVQPTPFGKSSTVLFASDFLLSDSEK
jgi:hypothetical protein